MPVFLRKHITTGDFPGEGVRATCPFLSGSAHEGAVEGAVDIKFVYFANRLQVIVLCFVF